jgi:hypothetical protein
VATRKGQITPSDKGIKKIFYIEELIRENNRAEHISVNTGKSLDKKK